MKEIEIYNGFWSQQVVKSNPDKIYIFGDNDLRIGLGGQAVIRNLSNTFGIRTKKIPSNTQDSFYSDSEYEFNKQKILQDVLQIKLFQISGNQIVFSDGGYGTGLASLKTKAPKTFKYLVDLLKSFFNYDNETGKIWKYIPSFDEINFAEYVDISECLNPINNSFFRDELLKTGKFNYFDAIRSELKTSFTSDIQYKRGQVINLNVGASEYLVVKVCESYKCDFVDNKSWSIFEGFSEDFINTAETIELYQTQFQFISTLNPDGTMRFKDNIFS